MPDLSRRTLCLTLISALVATQLRAEPTTAPTAAPSTRPAEAMLFSYFTGNGERGLRFATSDDGLVFRPLRNGRSFLAPNVGEEKIMRDPFLIQDPRDGTFHLLWTTAWKGKTIGHASSKDLLHWTDQQAIEVMKGHDGTRNCWAPEAIYDDRDGGRFVIFWSSTVDGRFNETQRSGDESYNHRIYSTTTRDFQTFTEAKLFYDPGFNVIDATFLHDASGKLKLIVKNETRNPAAKWLQIADAESPTGPFGPAGKPFTPPWVEGPTAIAIGDWNYAYYDAYTAGHFGAMRSKDCVTWEDITGQIKFPRGARHGTVLRVDRKLIESLEAAQ
ncbi:MAG: glycoside hydrolase family 43 protein [Tepidisphaeraceae bacterium]